MLAQLTIYAYEVLGVGLTQGDGYRDSRCGYGHIKSLHRDRLAHDYNVVVNGVVLLEGELCLHAHNKLHDFWDSLGGSPRIEADLNHYSLSHYGMI